MAQYKDFDAAWKDRRPKDPLSIKVGGEKFSLPNRVPASVVVLISRMRRGADVDQAMQADATIEVLEALLGKDNLPRLTSVQIEGNPIDMDQLQDILQWCMEQYGMSQEASSGQEAENSPFGLTPTSQTA